MIHVLSLGAGVQSSTLALMAAAGEITPMPDFAVFADTQAEPQAVYAWLDWLEKQLPFPVHRVTAGNLEEDTLQSMSRPRIANPPFYTGQLLKTHEPTSKAHGFNTVPGWTVNEGEEGQLRRQCTREYKIEPVRRYLRSRIGLAKGQRVKEVCITKWVGISTDEAHRAKLKAEPFEIIRYPLLEAQVSRMECLRWMQRHGFPKPSKSACYFCPYHDDLLWRDMKLNDPGEFQRAVVFDEAIRHGTVRGVDAPVFLHRSLKPLDQVDFRTAEDAGQERLFGGDPDDEKGFAAECEGMCGV